LRLIGSRSKSVLYMYSYIITVRTHAVPLNGEGIVSWANTADMSAPPSAISHYLPGHTEETDENLCSGVIAVRPLEGGSSIDI
jgi:hypothetical protein